MNVPDDLDPVLREIDEQLKAKGTPPHARGLSAVVEFGKRFKLSMPLTSVQGSAPPEVMKNVQYTQAIYDWYDQRYGERMKVDFSEKAKVAVLANGDLWELRIPLIIGETIIVPGRELGGYPDEIMRSPAIINPSKFLSHITPERLIDFTETDLHEAFAMFIVGFEVRQAFDRFRKAHPKFVEAESDWAVAVLHLTSQVPNYGQSRWASLQMAEKFMKGMLETIGDVEAKRVHNLTELHAALAVSIPSLNLDHLLDDIQCSAAVRYGETPSTRAEAYAAHKASLLLVRALGSVQSANPA